MGHVYAKAELQGIKSTREVRMLVDTGATFSVLLPELADELGVLRFPKKFVTTLADGRVTEVEAAIIGIEVKGRRVPTTVLILDAKEPLLGVEALEALGLKVNPATGALEPTRSYAMRA